MADDVAGSRPPRAAAQLRAEAKREAEEFYVRFHIPRGTWERFLLLVALTGQRKTDVLRRAVAEVIEHELARFPVRVVWLRPGATIYGREGSRWTPIAKGAGGERAWPIELAEMPAAYSPTRVGWRCDITSEGGYEGRGVFVAIEDVVGAEIPGGPPGD